MSSLLHYNCLDSACMVEAHNAFWPDLDHGFQEAYRRTLALYEPLTFMQLRGIKVDMVELEKVKVDIQKSAAEKQEELNRLCGRDLNVNSPKDCQNYFYIELGIPPYHNEGSITVDDMALQRMARGTAKRAGLRQAKLVQEIRGLQKLFGTYLNIEFDPDHRLRCSWNPRGTKFGRLSSSKTIFGTGTNQQNLPEEFKRFLVADGLFWEIDKRQAEWVVVAYLANDANMIRVIEEGKDTHVHTASLMFSVEPEILMLEDKVVGHNTDPDIIRELRMADPYIARVADRLPRTMSGRQCGKKSNHGLNYDETAPKFSLINEIELSEAKRIVELYHHIYPGIRNTYHENVKRWLQKDRFLTNCLGRRIRFMDAWGPDLWKAGYSAIPQSTVVDTINEGMAKTYHDPVLCSTDGFNIDLLSQTHDSMLLQLPAERCTDIKVMQHVLEQAQPRVFEYVSPELEYNGRRFKIATDHKIGYNWGSYNKGNPRGMREIPNMADLPGVLEKLNVEGKQ